MCVLLVVTNSVVIAQSNDGIDSITNGINGVSDKMDGLYKAVKKFIFWIAAIASVPLIAGAFITMLNGHQETSRKLFMIVGGIVAFFGLVYLLELVFEISK